MPGPIGGPTVGFCGIAPGIGGAIGGNGVTCIGDMPGIAGGPEFIHGENGDNAGPAQPGTPGALGFEVIPPGAEI